MLTKEEERLLIEHYGEQIMLKNDVQIRGLPFHIEKAIRETFTDRNIIRNIGHIRILEEKS